LGLAGQHRWVSLVRSALADTLMKVSWRRQSGAREPTGRAGAGARRMVIPSTGSWIPSSPS